MVPNIVEGCLLPASKACAVYHGPLSPHGWSSTLCSLRLPVPLTLLAVARSWAHGLGTDWGGVNLSVLRAKRRFEVVVTTKINYPTRAYEMVV